jgi:Zn finger protein HypA/HybF involved in hydrogenase expression
MTHDTPGDSGDVRRWCEHCRLSVEPEPTDSGPVCPSCGADLGGPTA